MTLRKITYVFLFLITFLGIAISVESVRQDFLYYSIRLWQGDVLRFNCYTIQIPRYWLIHTQEDRKDKVVYTLRKFHNSSKKYIFISIIPDYGGNILKHASMKEHSHISIKEKDHIIYELSALDINNTVRLFTKIYNSPFVLAGESPAIISEYFSDADLLTDMVKSTCKD